MTRPDEAPTPAGGDPARSDGATGAATPFAQRYAEALADPNVRGGLLPFQRAWRETRDRRIAELEADTGRSFDELRHELAETKAGVRADLPATLGRFRERAQAAGSTVVEVADAASARDYVAELCARHGARVVVKGKSMVSEEIFLNEHLEAQGVAPIETDLGEWILQLAHEHPSHLVMPAIHKRKEQIAALLTQVLGRDFPPDDIPGMVRSVRTELREHFLSAGMGLSGANALIADSGSVMLIANEGNGRLSTSLPPVHVVLAGFDKLLPTARDAMAQVRLLARSATGQPITSYTNFLTGPREGQEQHIVLIDNGRSAMDDDPVFESALGCIRCGACANVCPPYQVVGGHAFGHVYTGAIGLVNTEFHHGVDAAAGPQSLCVSCGACSTVCPVEIPLDRQILRVRSRVAEARPSRLRRFAFELFARRWLVAGGARAAAVVTRPWRRERVVVLPGPRRHVGWRTPPAIPVRPGRAEAKGHSGPAIAETAVTGKRVALFLQCLADRLMPEAVAGTASLIRAAGAEVEVPGSQHCCGLPAFDAGELGPARRMARATLDALGDADYVVTPAPSCAVMMLHDYAELLADDPTRAERAARLQGRVFDVVAFLSGPGRLPNGALDNGDQEPVTVHRFCQSFNAPGDAGNLESLVRDLCGVPVRPLPENGVCCGFGGSTSMRAPEVAAGILERKLDCVAHTRAGTLITDNPGCVLHMRGGAHASDRPFEVVHVAEYLAGRLPGAGAAAPR